MTYGILVSRTLLLILERSIPGKGYYEVIGLKTFSPAIMSLLDKIDDGIIGLNADKDIIVFNAAAEKMLAKAAKDVISHPFNEIFSDEFFGFSLEKNVEAKQIPEKTYSMHLSLKEVSRSLKTHFFSFDSTSNKKEDLAFVLLVKDVTEIERIELLLQKNERLKELGDVASLLTHEIRNPLGGIKGFASLLQRDLKDHPEWQQMATLIVKGADTLNMLVTHVLNFTRPIKLSIEKTDAIATVNDVKRYIQADTTFSKDIEIKIESKEQSLNIEVDSKLFRDAILNLMVNAMQAMPKGGILKVFISKDNNSVTIKISDTGEGIAPENIDKIFSPFFSTKSSCSGFGLVEVKKTVEAHGGTINVESSLGKGSTFTLTIPTTNKAI